MIRFNRGENIGTNLYKSFVISKFLQTFHIWVKNITYICNMKTRLLYILFLLYLLPSCNMLEYHPYYGDIKGEINLTSKNLELIQNNCADKETIRFAFISDTQGWFDQTRDAVNSINSLGDIDFVLHGGDLTDFGLPSEFEKMRDELNRLKMPWITTIGNHDCLANGERIYKQMFGETNYSFTVGTTKFIVINTNALEYDYINVPDMDFIRKQADEIETLNFINAGSITRTVFLMHSHPFDEQFNNDLSSEFCNELKRFPNVFCLGGHIHKMSTIDCFDNGIPFYIVSEIKKRKYLVFTINKDGYEKSEVEF